MNFTSARAHRFYSLYTGIKAALFLCNILWHHPTLPFQFASPHSDTYYFTPGEHLSISVYPVSPVTLLSSAHCSSSGYLWCHLDYVLPLFRHLQRLESRHLMPSFKVHPTLNPAHVSTLSFHYLTVEFLFWWTTDHALLPQYPARRHPSFKDNF